MFTNVYLFSDNEAGVATVLIHSEELVITLSLVEADDAREEEIPENTIRAQIPDEQENLANIFKIFSRKRENDSIRAMQDVIRVEW